MKISRHLLKGNVKEQLDTLSQWTLKKYTDIDAVIIISGEENDAEWVMFRIERHRLQGEAMKSSTLFYVNNRRWVLLNYPDRQVAQKAGMSFREYEDFLLNVCTMDYGKMEAALKPLSN